MKSLIVGLLMLISGLAFWIIKLYPIGAGLLITGVVFLIAQVINLRKPESERILDERAERINEKAGFHAFWILILSLAVTTALSWYFDLKLRETLTYVSLVGIYSFVILRVYFSRRGLE